MSGSSGDPRQVFESATHHFNMGEVHRALSLFKQVADAVPSLWTPWHQIGRCHERLENPVDALSAYERAALLAPEEFGPLLAISQIHDRAGESARALAVLEDVQKLDPKQPEIDLIYAQSLFLNDRLSEAWPFYRARHARPGVRPSIVDKPRWDGTCTAGLKLLLVEEQGVGEQVMFASMAQDLIDQGVSILIQCDPRLTSLLARSFPLAQVFSLASKDILPEFDAWIPLGDVGEWLRKDFSDFPSRPRYLVPPPSAKADIQDSYRRLAAGRLIVGICWKSPDARTAEKKTVDLKAWTPLLTSPGIWPVSLQYGDIDADLAAMKSEHGISIYADSSVDARRDMDRFAAQVDAVDAVVTVSNSGAHFAGALGKPTWVLLPHKSRHFWYWYPERSSCPWYPTVKAFGGKRDSEWSDVLSEISREVVATGHSMSLPGSKHSGPMDKTS